MVRRIASILLLFSLLLNLNVLAQEQSTDNQEILPGDYRIDEYLPLLKGKQVGLVINHTSKIGNASLLDTLISRKVKVAKIFAPEHGFRGEGDAGEMIKDGVDKATKKPVLSLHGKNKKPTAEQLDKIDVMIYDLQDVGVRFYTYISTLQYIMEACAENNIPLIVLDRPNPNGFYIDGPVLDTTYRSFVGMQPIPIVYGMTAGEYAKMLTGEKWYTGADKLNLTVVPCINYDHTKKYKLPVAPSPNLRNMAAVYSYPSLCLFEGTVVSIGRGTGMPFQIYGHPDFFGKFIYYFTPQSTVGASSPLYENRTCYGQIVAMNEQEALQFSAGRVRTMWLARAYESYPYKDKFFNSFFNKLSGNTELMDQIIKEVPEQEIQKSWEPDLKQFKTIRKQYLLYKDFEG